MSLVSILLTGLTGLAVAAKTTSAQVTSSSTHTSVQTSPSVVTITSTLQPSPSTITITSTVNNTATVYACTPVSTLTSSLMTTSSSVTPTSSTTSSALSLSSSSGSSSSTQSTTPALSSSASSTISSSSIASASSSSGSSSVVSSSTQSTASALSSSVSSSVSSSLSGSASALSSSVSSSLSSSLSGSASALSSSVSSSSASTASASLSAPATGQKFASSSSSSISSSASSLASSSSGSSISSSVSASLNTTASAVTSSAATASASTSPVTNGASVGNTILIFAVSDSDASSAYSGLNGYGIPYQVVIVPQGGITLPVLNSSATQGNYGGFIIVSDVSYDYSTGWSSALTNDQLTTIYNYQIAFGVRMVRLNSYPQSAYGTTTSSGGCCNSGVEQLISISNATGFPTANIKTEAGMTTENLYHYSATITDSNTWEVASFATSSDGSAPAGSAAVINNYAGRQQMVFFIAFGTNWSPTSAFLTHAFIHWMTRGLFVGARKIYFSTQIDDMHLSTPMYTNETDRFRLRPADLDAVASWQASINSRLPSGSMYKVEIGHNGNGNIINSTVTDTSNICNPDTAIYQITPPAPPTEFQKPLGSGTNIWPTTPANYVWTAACTKIDDLASWFQNPTNRDHFSHLSHTFSHMNLNNATYNDTNREIFFNQAWLAQVGISAGDFSSAGLIPPAITGLHNGDAIQAFMDNGLKYVVGDNTRSSLLNQNNNMWPVITTVAANGHDGLVIVPRWATAIYYDCSDANCTTTEWVQTDSGTNSFDVLIANEKFQNSFHLLSLSQAPYMFHQANLRTIDVATYTVGAQTAQMSLLQIWVETVTQEMSRLTNWPLVTLPHDTIAQKFVDRMTRDACGANLNYVYSSDRSSITAVTVTANGNTCSVPIPVTVPGGAPSSSGTSTSDQVGSEPLIQWVTLSGSAVTLTLPKPVSISM